MSTVRGRPFQKGNTFGRGRPKGSRNKSTSVVQQLLEEHSEPIGRKCVIEALKGNPAALKLCMERLAPVRHDAPVRVKLPIVSTAQDVSTAEQKVIQSIASGNITPNQGESIANTLEKRRKTIETVDMQARLERLERSDAERRKQRPMRLRT